MGLCYTGAHLHDNGRLPTGWRADLDASRTKCLQKNYKRWQYAVGIALREKGRKIVKFPSVAFYVLILIDTRRIQKKHRNFRRVSYMQKKKLSKACRSHRNRKQITQYSNVSNLLRKYRLAWVYPFYYKPFRVLQNFFRG